MNRIIAAVFGGFVVVAASTAHAQEQTTIAPDTGYIFGIGPAAGGASPGEPRPTPLFTLGDLNVGVWAPVEPHYNGEADRDPAAEPLWDMD